MHPHAAMLPCQHAAQPNSGQARRHRMVVPGSALLRWPHGAGGGTARRQGGAGQRRAPRTSAAPRRCGWPEPAPRWSSATWRADGRDLGGRGGDGGRRPGHRGALRRARRGVGGRLRRARRRRVRWRRLRRPQRGVEPSAPRHRRRRGRPRRVGTGDRDRRRGARCSWRAHAIPVHDGARRRVHRHHLLGDEHDRRVDPGRLRGVQGGAQPADASPRRPLRPRRHPRQCHRPRLHPHRDGGGPGAARRAGAPGRGQPDPAPRARPTTSPGWSCSSAATPRPTSTDRCSTSTAGTRSPG